MVLWNVFFRGLAVLVSFLIDLFSVGCGLLLKLFLLVWIIVVSL